MRKYSNIHDTFLNMEAEIAGTPLIRNLEGPPSKQRVFCSQILIKSKYVISSASLSEGLSFQLQILLHSVYVHFLPQISEIFKENKHSFSMKGNVFL